MNRHTYQPLVFFILFCTAELVCAEEWQFTGHIKYQLTAARYDDSSVFEQLGDHITNDNNMDVRLKADKHRGKWSLNLHYLLLGLYGDSLIVDTSAATGDSLSTNILGTTLPNDDLRLFDLSWQLQKRGKLATFHRIDRASIGYTSGQMVFRLGRQVVSWGNGQIYHPFDIFNPFDPTAIDKEYKTGDDMVYVQRLMQDGSDFQGLLLPRRDFKTHKVEYASSSTALKYHKIVENNDYDILIARHYSDEIVGVGLAKDLAGAVLASDVTFTRVTDTIVVSLIVNLRYSWIWSGKNVSGMAEYYHNGFGQSDGDYTNTELATNLDLLERLRRGEIFTLAKNYIAGSVTIELSPLWRLTPNLLVNIDDSSSFFQMVANYDWKQNVSVLAGVAVPVGPDGTEFGGIPSSIPGIYSGPGNAIFAKMSYYF